MGFFTDALSTVGGLLGATGGKPSGLGGPSGMVSQTITPEVGGGDVFSRSGNVDFGSNKQVFENPLFWAAIVGVVFIVTAGKKKRGKKNG